MKRDLWLINDQGKVAPINEGATAFSLSLGSTLANDLDELPRDSLPKRLGILLSSVHCFWTPLPEQSSGAYTSYDLEESLPLDAEELHFVYQADRFHQNAIAISTSQILPLIKQLEQRDVDIDFVAPWSTVLLEHVLKTNSIRSGQVIIENQSHLDLFEIENRRIMRWQVAWSSEDVLEKIGSEATGSPRCVVVSAAESDLAQRLEAKKIEWNLGAFTDSLTQNRKPLLLGNLAHGKLESNQRKQAYHRSLFNSLVATLLLLLTVAGISFYQADQEANEAESIRVTQTRRLRKTFAALPRKEHAVWLKQQATEARKSLTWVQNQIDSPSLLPILHRALEATETQLSQSTMQRIELDLRELRIEADLTDPVALERQLSARSFDIESQGIETQQRRSIVARPTDVQSDRVREGQ